MPQQNIVRQDGVRSALLSVFKTGAVSTLQVASGVKAAMASVLKTVTENLQVKQFADQSIFVKAAISGVVREGVIAAALTALMILLFLGSWRSTLIIAISIPLSVLASLAALSAIGDTFNLMTLGGLALAVGILVDDVPKVLICLNYGNREWVGADVVTIRRRRIIVPPFCFRGANCVCNVYNAI